MEYILPYLRQDFERVYKMIDDTPFISRGLISFRDVLKAHYYIADYFIHEGEKVIFGVKDLNILGSALGRQVTGFSSFNKWGRSEEICASLFFGLIKNHAFYDINKRTALLTLLYHLYRYGRTINVKQIEFENLAINVATDNYSAYKQYSKFKKSSDPEIMFIADFIRSSTRNIDKRYYPVTFQEFNTLLKRYNCYIRDAGGNYADVFKIKKEKKLLGLKEQEKHIRVIQIGFPGWKKQMNPKAVKEVLKATELTEVHGVDSQSFFHGAEPLGALIDIYQGPLKRLKDK